MAFSEDNQKLAITYLKDLKIYDLSTKSLIFSYDLPHFVTGLTFLGDGHSVAVAYRSEGVEIIDAEDINAPVKNRIKGKWQSLSLSRDGRYLVTGENVENKIVAVAVDWREKDAPRHQAKTDLTNWIMSPDSPDPETYLVTSKFAISGSALFEATDEVPPRPNESTPEEADLVAYLYKHNKEKKFSLGVRDMRTFNSRHMTLKEEFFPEFVDFRQTARGPRTMFWFATDKGAGLFIVDLLADKVITNQLFPDKALMPFGFDGKPYFKNAVLSPDGMLVAINYPDQSIHIFASDEVETPEALIKPDEREDKPVLALTQGHHSLIDKIVFSPDGSLFATTGTAVGGRTHIWETKTGRQLRSVAAGESVRMLQFSPDGKTLFTDDNSFTLWDVMSGNKIASLPASNFTLVSYIGDSDQLLACTTATCMIGDMHEIADFTGEKLDVPDFWYSDGAVSTAISPDGRFAGILLADGKALLIDIEKKKAIKIGARKHRLSLAFGDNGIGLWGLDRGEIELFDAKSGDVIERFKTGTDKDEVRIIPLDGTRFLIENRPRLSAVSSRVIFDGAKRSLSDPLPELGSGEKDFTYWIAGYYQPRDELYIASHRDFFSKKEVSIKSRIEVWSLADNKLLRTISTNSLSPKSLYFSKDSNVLYINGEIKEASWDLLSGKVSSVAGSIDKNRQFVTQHGRLFRCPGKKDRGTLCYDSRKTGEHRIRWEKDGEKTTRFETDGVSNGKDLLYVSWLDDVFFRIFDMEAIDRGERGLKANFTLEGGNDNSYPNYLLSPDGSRILAFSKEITMIEVGTGKRLWTTKVVEDGYHHEMSFSEDGTKILVFEYVGGDRVFVLDAKTGEQLTVVKDAVLVKSKVGTARILSTADENTFALLDDLGETTAGPVSRLGISLSSAQFDAVPGLILLNGYDGRSMLWDTRNGGSKVHILDVFGGRGSFSPDGKLLALSETSGLVSLWRVEDGQKIASLASLLDGGWAVIDEDGRYDASDPGNFPALGWVMPDEPNHVLPLELFYREYYEPTLLPRLLNGEDFPSLPKLADINRLQPRLQIGAIETDAGHPGTVSVSVEFSETQEDDRTSGIGTIKLFRDGQLVGQHTPTEEEKAGNRAIRFDNILLPRAETQSNEEASEVREQTTAFSAYAFNREGIKSETVSKAYRLPEPAETDSPASRTAYVISVGIDLYDNPAWNLNFAGADASVSADDVAMGLEGSGLFDKVLPVKLVSSSADAEQNGTRAQIAAVLDILGGGHGDPAALAGVANAEKLARARPEDMVFFFFAGHGLASRDGQFYLFPKDFDQTQQGRQINAETLSRALGSSRLADLFLDIQSDDIILIIDACNSAASVNSNGFKPGPMGSRGLGQLAYDKGMRILTASQAEGVAMESSLLRHGALSYALFREGLEGLQADRAPADRQISFAELLNYGEERVPTLYEEIVSKSFKPLGRGGMSMSFVVSGEAEKQTSETRYLQRPSLFDFKRSGKGVKPYLAPGGDTADKQ
ncbi:caspase family protein [uncultured Cohaesibacter sp.]|uniref:caspase family protein n=1 Tax=uncultured Cohaesibacter sp. TaxID=1002546 RepID=UPI00292E934C|nr:caspase family protein [uncultured Cohaesibacter sp.]